MTDERGKQGDAQTPKDADQAEKDRAAKQERDSTPDKHQPSHGTSRPGGNPAGRGNL